MAERFYYQRKGDHWVVYNENGRPVQSFSDKEAAQKNVEFRDSQAARDERIRREIRERREQQQQQNNAPEPHAQPQLPAPPTAPSAPALAPPPMPAASLTPPPPAPAIPTGYTYIPAHIRRVSRAVDEVGEEARSGFRGFPGAPQTSPSPNVVQSLTAAFVGAFKALGAAPAGATAPPPSPMGGVANVPANVFPMGMQRAAGMVPPPLPPPPPTRWGTALNQFRKTAQSAFMYGGGRGLARAAGAAFGAGFPEVTLPVAIVKEFGEALVGTLKGMRDFAENLVNTNRALVPFAPGLVRSYAMLDLHEFQRNIDYAKRTQPSADALVRAVDNMRSSLQDINVAYANTMNGFGQFAAGAVGRFGEIVGPGANALGKVVGAPDNQILGWLGEKLTNLAFQGGPHLFGPGVGMIFDLVRQIKGDPLKANAPNGDPKGPLDEFALEMLKGNLPQPMVILPQRPGQAGRRRGL